MKKGKPIEPGCLAQIVKALTPDGEANVGRVVTVINLAVPGAGYPTTVAPPYMVWSSPDMNRPDSPNRYWDVKVEPPAAPLVWPGRTGPQAPTKLVYVNCRPIAEHCLIRLDDDETLNDEETTTDLTAPTPTPLETTH